MYGRKSSNSNEAMLLLSCRFTRELSPLQDWFAVEDEENVLDIPNSFGPQGARPIALKLLATSFTTFTLIYSVMQSNQLHVYFGLLSGVALAFSMCYMWVSLANSIIGVGQPRRLEKVPRAVRLQWLLFNLSLHATVFAAVLWWVSVFELGEITLTLENVSLHGGTLLTMALEGFVVNRIPIRWYFWWGVCLPVVVLYIGWTYLHAELEIGNSNDENGLLYELFDWKNDLTWTGIQAAISILALSPFVQTIAFLISLYGLRCHNVRRYVNEEELRKSGHRQENSGQVNSGQETTMDDPEQPQEGIGHEKSSELP